MGPGGAGGGMAWLLLASGVFLSQASSQAPPQGFRYVSYEVIIPRRMAPRRGREPQDLTYLVELQGKGRVVHLRQKRGFVPQHFPVFTYGKEGDLQADYPFVRDDCFYHGFVQGQPSSLVAVSTCSGGLRGLLQVENKTYEIEPVQAPTNFQHVVYRLEEKEGAVRMRCGLTKGDQNLQEATIQIPENVELKSSQGALWQTHARYVKVAVVVEHELFVHTGRNESLAAREVLDIVHIADSLYKPLGIHVVLVGLEIWSQKNLMAIAKSIDELLDVFNTWRKTTFIHHLRHDVGHLFVYKHFGDKLGLSFVGTVCDPIWASAVEAFITSSLFSFTITFAHQLGHNLGMQHDEKYCTCSQHSCIMASLQSNTSQFSNCSFDSYSTLMNSGRKQCLLIPPEHEKLYELENCGNKVVESGEQCDCGSEFHCELDACCQSNCMLRSGATCASGTCCANCQFLPAGTVCRERTDICDLPEYCTGISEWCPEDVYVQDGAPCYDGAYCYHGKCSTHIQQCKMIFGKQATVAPLDCFKEINTRGDRFGNCGIIPGDVYKKCETSSILCGRVQCINIDKVSNLNEHNTIIQTPVNNNLCWGTYYPSGMGIADIGAVRDGTQCGDGMICINRYCIKVSLLNYDCNQTKCHNRGMCNSHKNCHCDYGWAPPYCLNEGYGGSIDSGPPPPKSGNLGMTISIVIVIFTVVIGAGVGII
ncbi:and metalloproteinase domain-containing 20-like [Podarcis lilfordi]|uniref:And metalloproteinase domain-containing 20-like n=1 Tax=Podarcis lilfordi TaxID=74358 RepID=A0AA35NXD1_9SAUR|nr:and metalloproteinase domain-containing 20-like [Podarcis lilfordi]